jgi:RimJ/RimL family protein N-acetyltransferase
VVARDRAVVGYLNYWLVADEVHLLAIATHPDARRRGVAAALMAHLVEAARDARVITLEVRASNRPAIALYERFGFPHRHPPRRWRRRRGRDRHAEDLSEAKVNMFRDQARRAGRRCSVQMRVHGNTDYSWPPIGTDV